MVLSCYQSGWKTHGAIFWPVDNNFPVPGEFTSTTLICPQNSRIQGMTVTFDVISQETLTLSIFIANFQAERDTGGKYCKSILKSAKGISGHFCETSS
jgi:hypothetical protein